MQLSYDMSLDLSQIMTLALVKINSFLGSIVNYNISPSSQYNLPLYVAWLLACGIFCNIYFRFPFIKYFRHAIHVVRDKYLVPDDPGYISHSQAIYTSALSSVGLGSVAGVAVAVVVGGPGAIFWLTVIAIFNMTIKFAEVYLAHKYRQFKDDGTILGGPFFYIREGMAKNGMIRLGKIMAIVYGVAMLLNAMGGANMFQANQTALVISQTSKSIAAHPQLIALLITGSVAAVVIGNLKQISKIAESVVPLMTISYLIVAIIVVLNNIHNIIPALRIIVVEAFYPKAMYGSVATAATMGFLRATYATETGGGTSGIAHAPSKTKESIREGMTGFIEILLSASVCILTGLIVVITGAYEKAEGIGGVLVTRAALETVSPAFGNALAVIVFFLAITTIIAWHYYGSVAWRAIFGDRGLPIFTTIFLSATYYGSIAGNTPNVVQLCDYFWVAITIPNMIVIYIMAPSIKRDLNEYTDKLKKGLFPCRETPTRNMPFFK